MSKYVHCYYPETTLLNARAAGLITSLDSVCQAHHLSHHLSMLHSSRTSITEGAGGDNPPDMVVEQGDHTKLFTVPTSKLVVKK